MKFLITGRRDVLQTDGLMGLFFSFLLLCFIIGEIFDIKIRWHRSWIYLGGAGANRCCRRRVNAHVVCV